MSIHARHAVARLALWLLMGACLSVDASLSKAADPFDATAGLLQRFCIECHSDEVSEAGLNLQHLVENSDIAADFRQWRKVGEMVQQVKMPPEASSLPSDSRRQLFDLIRGQLRTAAMRHSDDPGPVTMRRLTSAEYDYTMTDLTGLDLDLGREFVGDAVGGEGFTNVGGAQFVQDSTLQQYLAAAKRIADHAVIGSGPLRFYQDPGQTGLELSAINRINEIYRQHGFRTAAGEGGQAFGLDHYQRAFWVAWLFLHRTKLEMENETLETLARRENVDVRFAQYVWSVLNRDSLRFPTSDIVARWRALPAPAKDRQASETVIRSRCAAIQAAVNEWHDRLGENPDAKEEARVLSASTFDVGAKQAFEMNINWPKGTKTAHVTIEVKPADRGGQSDFVVIWRDPVMQYRIPDRVLDDPRPLRSFIADDEARNVNFGVNPKGQSIAARDFVTVGSRPLTIEIPVIQEARSARLMVEAELDMENGQGCIVRCTISQREDTDQGKSVSALLANPESPTYQRWKDGVLEFARLLPQISQREPAPSDRDPIPAPFDPIYNNPERNHFHARIKYHRDDDFLVDNILNAATRERLDQAWFDLLGSFDYCDAMLRFVAGKYAIDLGKRGMADLDEPWIERLAAEPRKYVRQLHSDFHAMRQAFAAAEPGHLEDVIGFAELAWRRPLELQEQSRLREFYSELRKDAHLSHREAIRAILARVLIAPAFIYRAEIPRRGSDGDSVVPLSNWELASRLSYFLWSSTPDAELRRAAASGELLDPDQLIRQARRMIRDPKSRRFSTEFFGQWFGFYQFDRYRGVDPDRFPEFTDELKAAMHDEAVSFFEHIVRNDRPLREILFADYTFANRQLADHYGFPNDVFPNDAFSRAAHSIDDESIFVDDVGRFHRGGLFGLGTVLTTTSAPRRTSPVKRGDWVLRRVLGSPVPPPPPDAGSLPADDVLADGKTVRQRLAAHRRDATCNNCHSRIDPLGFSLEHFNAIGQWRDRYRDGAAIETSGTLSDGTTVSGLPGLRDYLKANEDLFRRTLCTKLLGYALGRGESIADVLLIEQLVADAKTSGTFSALVERIVTSRQFRYQRTSDQ